MYPYLNGGIESPGYLRLEWSFDFSVDYDVQHWQTDVIIVINPSKLIMADGVLFQNRINCFSVRGCYLFISRKDSLNTRGG